MAPLNSAIWFGGLVMAHAAWIVSDMEEGSLLCPFAMLQSGDDRWVIAFESESQHESVQQGKASLAEHSAAVDFWGFAHDGLLSYPGWVEKKVDVLTVSSWRRGLDEPIILRQRYVPNVQGRFRLLGSIEIAIHGMVAPEPAQTTLNSLAMSGVEDHPHGDLYGTWTTN